jgi:hypothetical protein
MGNAPYVGEAIVREHAHRPLHGEVGALRELRSLHSSYLANLCYAIIGAAVTI